MSKNEKLVLRMNILGGMNEFMKDCGDEEPYEDWISVVPDNATEDDLKEIAEDVSQWVYVCKWFSTLINHYSLM